MVRITGVQNAPQRPSIVHIDPYVPISFRSDSRPLAGARYVRLGNFKTELLVLQFPAESLVLSGFTLVSCKVCLQGTLSGQGPSVEMVYRRDVS
jgi:hypothetical protein